MTIIRLLLGSLLICSFQAVAEKGDSLTSTLTSIINQHYPTSGAAAVVLIEKGQQTILKKPFGQSIVEYQVPANINMKFRIASITKQFTAVAVLMLMEQGKLDLKDNINTYVPEYSQSQHNGITIYQLLTHSAGIPNYGDHGGYDHHGTDRVTMDSILKVFSTQPLDFKPGTSSSYSNSGYLLLGKIIENVSGQSYAEFISQHIFNPLGMDNSSFYDFYEVVPGLSKGYEYSESANKTLIHAKPVKPGSMADGSIVSTIDDLGKWYRAIRSNKLISADSKTLAFTPYTLQDGRNTKQGLGWRIAKIGDFQTAEHGGNNHGTEGYALYIPEANLNIVILSNLNRSDPASLAEKLASTILNIPNKTQQKINLSNNQLKRFTGKYKYSDGEQRTITLKDNRLYSSNGKGNYYKLVPFASNKFYFEQAPVYWLTFKFDKSGKVIGLKSENRTSMAIQGIKVGLAEE